MGVFCFSNIANRRIVVVALTPNVSSNWNPFIKVFTRSVRIFFFNVNISERLSSTGVKFLSILTQSVMNPNDWSEGLVLSSKIKSIIAIN